MTRLIPFRAEHLFHFVDRDHDVVPTLRDGLLKEKSGPSFTAVINDKIVGCAGIMILWKGVGYGWVAFGKEIERHPVWFTRMVRAVVRDTIRNYDLHRIEAAVLADNPKNDRWALLLGFTVEVCRARAYTQDKRDVIRYELIP